MDEYLKHYGVIGMRWGVRRFQPYPSSYKGPGKEVGVAKKKSSRIGYDDDVLIKKGTKAYRISANKKGSGNQTYLTVDQNDRRFYKHMWPKVLKGSAGVVSRTNNIYEQRYKTTADLISPSASKRQKIASDLTNRPDVQAEIAKCRMIKTISHNQRWSTAFTKQQYAAWEEDKDPKFLRAKKAIEKATKSELSKASEQEKAVIFLGNMGTSDRLKFIIGEEVAKQGYNMLIDDHGADFAGKGQRVNAPIIALKVDETLKQVGSQKVSTFLGPTTRSNISIQKYDYDMMTTPGKMSEKYFVPNVIKEATGTDNYYRTWRTDYPYDKR